mgnify:FL=1
MAAGWSPLMSEAYFKRGACQGGEISTREAGKIANDRWGKEQTSAKPAQIHHARILCPKNGGCFFAGFCTACCNGINARIGRNDYGEGTKRKISGRPYLPKSFMYRLLHVCAA